MRIELRGMEGPEGMLLDPFAGRATVAGCTVRLTRIELALLAALADHAPLDRRALLGAVWGYAHDPGTNLVAVHLSRLRTKLGSAIVVHGPGGYRLGAACPR